MMRDVSTNLSSSTVGGIFVTKMEWMKTLGKLKGLIVKAKVELHLIIRRDSRRNLHSHRCFFNHTAIMMNI
jgi:hypothetical protein